VTQDLVACDRRSSTLHGRSIRCRDIFNTRAAGGKECRGEDESDFHARFNARLLPRETS
jgi:hypothetical protein